MTYPNTEHDAAVKLICGAVAMLMPRFQDRGITAEVLFEGAIKGGAAAIMATGATPQDVAELLDFAPQALQ